MFETEDKEVSVWTMGLVWEGPVQGLSSFLLQGGIPESFFAFSFVFSRGLGATQDLEQARPTLC